MDMANATLQNKKTTDETITLPTDSKIPKLENLLANADAYDEYFNIVRDTSGLIQWSRSCLSLHDVQLEDIEISNLTSEEKVNVLQGMLLVQRMTISKWIDGIESLTKDLPE